LQAYGLADDVADVAAASEMSEQTQHVHVSRDIGGFDHPELQVLEEPPRLPVDIVGGRPVNTELKPGDTVCLLSDPGRHFTVVMQADNFVSLSFINDRVANVRFTRTVQTDTNIQNSDWIATITFRYTNAPMAEGDRYRNPLGFQVENYRADPEVVR
jgi:hypothetical protein